MLSEVEMKAFPKLVMANIAMAATLALGAIPDQMNPDFDLREVPLPQTYNTLALGFLQRGRARASGKTDCQEDNIVSNCGSRREHSGHIPSTRFARR